MEARWTLIEQQKASVISDLPKLVVETPIDILCDEQSGRYAARIMVLGLTGYGETENGAKRKVQSMFESSIHAHCLAGTLEQYLNRSGVKWSWTTEI